MKKLNIKGELPLLLIILAMFLVSIYFYPLLPDKVPTHWNFRGEIDGYSGKLMGALLMPIINLIMYILFIFLPLMDPKKENYKLFVGTYKYFRYLFHIFFLGMHVMIITAALGYKVNVTRLTIFSISLLFSLMGNVMGRVKHNYFVGIKTPWTLASEEVWTKTHRLAALLWTAGGIAGMALSLFNVSSFLVLMAILLLPSLIPVIYSYFIFKKLSDGK
ncbi:MAG: SdpI family protein [Clostridiales bacterium]|nr:SdpI family protein [Clostridiales bacterium]